MTKQDIEKLTPQECESAFQEALSKNDWDTVYYCIDFVCHNQCKKMLKGIKISPELFELRVGEAVLECFEKIKVRGDKPEALSAYTYWPCRRALINKKAMQEDREMLDYSEYTEMLESKGYYYEENI